MPAGSEPVATENTSGDRPPLPRSCAPYGWPTTPALDQAASTVTLSRMSMLTFSMSALRPLESTTRMTMPS